MLPVGTLSHVGSHWNHITRNAEVRRKKITNEQYSYLQRRGLNYRPAGRTEKWNL
jgi:hypothetical protein